MKILMKNIELNITKSAIDLEVLNEAIKHLKPS